MGMALILNLNIFYKKLEGELILCLYLVKLNIKYLQRGMNSHSKTTNSKRNIHNSTSSFV